MLAPVLPCKYCRTLIPRFDLGSQAFEAVVRALSNGSKTLVAAELRHFVQCREVEAQTWVNHLLTCAHAWPSTEADQKLFSSIDQAFDGIAKPEHFTNYEHCGECKEHDDTLRKGTRETLRREDLGNAGWDPITFSSVEGMGYYFPVLARFALLPDVWTDHSWYGSQLLSHLSWDGGTNRFLAWCSPKQRDAVYALLNHLMATRMPAITNYGDEDALLNALVSWQPPNPSLQRTLNGAAEL